MDERDVCLNCQFFDKTTGNPTYDGWCLIKLPPQFPSNRQNGIRFADERTCSLHQHLNRRIG